MNDVKDDFCSGVSRMSPKGSQEKVKEGLLLVLDMVTNHSSVMFEVNMGIAFFLPGSSLDLTRSAYLTT